MGTWEPVAEQLLEERGARLVAYAAMLVARDADAEDLVQDAVVKCFSRRRSVATVGEAEAYARRAMQTIVIDRARARGVRKRATDRAFSREPDTADLDAGLDVRRALRALTPREQVCIVMRYFDDLPVAEIAVRLELADGTVKRYISNATNRLAPLLAGAMDWGTPPDRVEVLSTKKGK
jgi:RNA polymerase sigma-70 factor (ECF subfamily)